MRYKLLSIPSNNGVNNIGDYIQALAALQFFPSYDGFVNREALNEYNGEECLIIMNGWFMHHPNNWPPAEIIKPLFVAFHLNDSAKSGMLSKRGFDYLKGHEPIGCRDRYTERLLVQRGIKAYFSGCLTLTLGKNYGSKQHNGGCYIVDPIIPRERKLKDLILDLNFLVRHYHDVFNIIDKLYLKGSAISRIILTARFLRIYSMWFDYSVLINASYIQQESTHYTLSFSNDEERLKEAERLVRLYSEASFVITRRIHCALPCLGMETPVYFVAKEKEDFISTCRYEGILELFNVFYCDSHQLRPSFLFEGKIGYSNICPNKDSWKKLAHELVNTCNAFVKRFQ